MGTPQCFQAGVICSTKCKCVSCSNHAGSQKLIDKRRKMKDQGGAEYAMKISQELWERPSSTPRSVAPQFVPQRLPMASPGGLRSPATSMSGVFRSTERPGRGGINLPPSVSQSHLIGAMAPPLYGHGPHPPLPPPHMGPVNIGMGFSTRMGPGAPPITPGMGRSTTPQPPQTYRSSTKKDTAPMPRTTFKRPAKQITPASTGPTPGRLLRHDPSTNKKGRKADSDEEPSYFFGRNVPPHSMATASTVFSFLTKEDIFSASLVCRSWNVMSMDRELWKFGGGQTS